MILNRPSLSVCATMIKRRRSDRPVVKYRCSSHARGEAGPDSDVDLLVILPVEGPKRKKLLEIRTALMGMGLPKDILIATPEEVELYRDVAGTIIEPALREGRVLYERPA